MVFIMENNIICVGKYVVNDGGDGTCSINILSSSNNAQMPLCDNVGRPIKFELEAMKSIEHAVRQRWTYVDLKQYQIQPERNNK